MLHNEPTLYVYKQPLITIRIRQDLIMALPINL